jgi:Uma2 family endonuclease
MTAPNPVIVVEVFSPSTGNIDKTVKLADYFRVPGLAHYVIADPDRRRVLHYRRQTDGDIASTILDHGVIAFDPPGIAVTVASFLD